MDFRKINEVTIADSSSLPNTTDIGPTQWPSHMAKKDPEKTEVGLMKVNNGFTSTAA